MAKKKKPGGTSIGLIMVLIFFVLATFICGTVAYFGYSQIEQDKGKVAEAEKQLKTAQAQMRKERALKIVYRMALGIQQDDDRGNLLADMEFFRNDIREEYDNVRRQQFDAMKLAKERIDVLKKERDITKDPDRIAAIDSLVTKLEKIDLAWPLMTKDAAAIKGLADDPGRVATDDRNELGVRPNNTFPELLVALIDIYAYDAKKGKQLDELAGTYAKLAADAASGKGDAEREFKQKAVDLAKSVDARYLGVETQFKNLEASLKNAGKGSQDKIADLGRQINDLIDQKGKLADKIRELQAFDAATTLIAAQADYFRALADYHAAVGEGGVAAAAPLPAPERNGG